jgi:predicted Fe-Mo cluster-binding NifX family protein
MSEGTDPVDGIVVCVPVTADRQVDHSWGKATVVATAVVRDGTVVSWTQEDVGWDVSHDQGGHGSHHTRIARFLLERKARAVAAGHMGAPMFNMLTKMGLTVLLEVSGDAETAANTAASRVPA